MKKAILSLITTMTIFTALIPCALSAEIIASGNCGANGNNVTWTLDDAGTLTMSGTGDMADWEFGTRTPWANNRADITNIKIEKGVTSIGNHAFSDFDSLTYMSNMPQTITRIGESAFRSCNKLLSVSIGDGVTTIDKYAFDGCTKLQSVYMKSSPITNIGYGAFCCCYVLQNITLPDTVTHIGDKAFLSCFYLSKITIPKSVTHIGSQAFSGDRLTSVNIPSGTEYIGAEAFAGNTNCIITVDENNEYFSSLDGVLFNKDKTDLIACTIGAKNTENGIYIIPDGVTAIKEGAFHNITFNGITLPDSLITIEDEAFAYTNLKTELFIPKNVTNIGTGVFSVSGTSFNVDEDNEAFASVDGVLFNKDKTELIAFPCKRKDTSYIIPDGTVTIAPYAFAPSYLTQIGFPNSIASVESTAFSGCNALTDVYYEGSESDWNKIDISEYGNNNKDLINAEKHYNSNLVLVPEPTVEPSPTPTATPTPVPTPSLPPFIIDGNTVTNTTDTEQTVNVIISFYNDTGAPISVTREERTFKPNNTAVFQNLTGNFRIFIWDSLEGMRPLTQ